jgi:hypothetical protein
MLVKSKLLEDLANPFEKMLKGRSNEIFHLRFFRQTTPAGLNRQA